MDKEAQGGIMDSKEPRLITMCKYYSTSGYPSFKPRCSLGHFAKLACHSENRDCKHYEPSEKPPFSAGFVDE